MCAGCVDAAHSPRGRAVADAPARPGCRWLCRCALKTGRGRRRPSGGGPPAAARRVRRSKGVVEARRERCRGGGEALRSGSTRLRAPAASLAGQASRGASWFLSASTGARSNQSRLAGIGWEHWPKFGGAAHRRVRAGPPAAVGQQGMGSAACAGVASRPLTARSFCHVVALRPPPPPPSPPVPAPLPAAQQLPRRGAAGPCRC
jgi:hypothetical protein